LEKRKKWSGKREICDLEKLIRDPSLKAEAGE
jgi:hypothetical protein